MPEAESIIESDMPDIKDDPVKQDNKAETYFHLNGKMLHVRVGDDNWDEDTVEKEIERIKEDLQELLNKNGVDCLVYVTHKFVEIRAI